MDQDLVGILVAGGQSRRFGSPKAFLKRNGKYFFEYSIDALQTVANSLIIATNSDLQPFFQREEERFFVITDKIGIEGLGPLAGIYSGMDYVSGEWYAVAPTDVPFIEGTVYVTLASYLEEDIDAVVPIVANKYQPLLAIYHHRVKKVILDLLMNKERSLNDLLKKIHVKYVTIDNEKAFYNINEKSDYDKWVRPR